jgi:hypothetical protein
MVTWNGMGESRKQQRRKGAKLTHMITQLEFQMSQTGKSQTDRILMVLQRNLGAWVPMPELALAASRTGIGVAVHSRANDLRRAGYAVENKTEKVDGIVHSFYRLNVESNEKGLHGSPDRSID